MKTGKMRFGLVVLLTLCLSAASAVLFQLRAEEGIAISKDGVPISYSVYGKGEPTLVFVHGWSCNRSVWRKQIPYFEKRYRVVVLDLAGHGASGNGRTVYALRAFGEDVAAVVQAVHASRVILIGHSMGGPVIIEAGQIMPDTVIALVGIDTLHDLDEAYTPEQVEEIIRPFKEDFKRTTVSFVQSMFVKGADPKFIEEITEMMSNASPNVGISALEEMLSNSYAAHPPKITVSVWVLNSNLWPTKAEVNLKYLSEFNVRIMPGVGHFLMLEKPDEFNRRLDNIIKNILKRKENPGYPAGNS